MVTTMSDGGYVYEVAEGWGKLPEGWDFGGDAAGVGVDKDDRVYVFNRGAHPVIIFDREGNFIGSWGEGLFTRAHGVTMGPDDTIYLTDDGDHTVRKCTLDGKVLLTIGSPGKPTPFHSGLPFNRCTHVALSPDGEIYVSDGYCNSKVHKYTPAGEHMFSWGESGTLEGQFNVPHNICTDGDGIVYVADRENHRVQLFSPDGKFISQWVNMARPCGMYLDQKEKKVYTGDLGTALSINEGAPGIGPRVCIYDLGGKLLAKFGDSGPAELGFFGEEVGKFIAPHSVAIDSVGDIYVGEVSWAVKGRHLDPPRQLRCIQKLIKKY